MNQEYVNRVVDLTDPQKNIIYNMSLDEAKELVRSGNIEGVRGIDGQFALFAVEGKTISGVIVATIISSRSSALSFACSRAFLAASDARYAVLSLSSVI